MADLAFLTSSDLAGLIWESADRWSHPLLALETARSGVTVNAVCPGYADTDMATASIDNVAAKTGKSREDALAAMIKDNPQGRLIAPDEVAAAVLYLCGSGSDAVTGQSLMINGGEF